MTGLAQLAAVCYFHFCLAFGRLLRSARYANAATVNEDGVLRIRKRRAFYAPVLVSMGVPLMRILSTGVRVLPQRDWEARERLAYRSLYGASIRVDADGALVLPCLPGETLATLLDDAELDVSTRRKAIELAVAALAALHRLGFTHADAMAENVLIDLGAGAAHWFDFETVHDESRSTTWRRADDLRALLVTCLVRTERETLDSTLELVLDVYDNQDVNRALSQALASVWRRPLAFHLGQAGLSFQDSSSIARVLGQRSGNPHHDLR